MSHVLVQTKLDRFFKPALLRSKTSKSPLSMNKCIVFLQFLNRGSRVIFCYFLSLGTPYIIKFSIYFRSSLNFPFIFVLSYFVSYGYL
jgi:hypothetical protein